MYKFCREFNEDENAYTGGVTICESITKLFSKKKQEDPSGINPGANNDVLVTTDEAVEDEYADMEAAAKEEAAPQKNNKKQNKCVVCCKAFFCCKTGNTVSKEAEMAQIKAAQSTADRAKGVNGDKD